MDNKQVTLGGYTYTMRHAPARQSLHVCARLGNAGAAFFAGLGSGRGAERLTNAVAYMLQSPQLSEIVLDIVNTFAPYTSISSEKTAAAFGLDTCVDVHFAGRMKDFAAWIAAVVEFECGDFLEDVGAQLAALLKKGGSESPSPTAAEATGKSGA